jgi:hypothetical protein
MEEKKTTKKDNKKNDYKLDLNHYDKFCLMTDIGITLYDENGKEIPKKK